MSYFDAGFYGALAVFAGVGVWRTLGLVLLLFGLIAVMVKS